MLPPARLLDVVSHRSALRSPGPASEGGVVAWLPRPAVAPPTLVRWDLVYRLGQVSSRPARRPQPGQKTIPLFTPVQVGLLPPHHRCPRFAVARLRPVRAGGVGLLPPALRHLQGLLHFPYQAKALKTPKSCRVALFRTSTSGFFSFQFLLSGNVVFGPILLDPRHVIYYTG